MTVPPTDIVSSHLRKARSKIASGRVLLPEFADEAGRQGYMAMFHAALALIVSATGKEPKTHRGTHVEFARLAKDNEHIPRALVQVLGTTYELKAAADYEIDTTVTTDEAKTSLDTAEQFIATISSILTPPP